MKSKNNIVLPYTFNIKVSFHKKSLIDYFRHSTGLNFSHVGHSRTIIGIEQRASGLTLLVLDPSHGPRQVAALGSSHESLRLIRRNTVAMRAPQYQVVAVRGLIESEEQYQVGNYSVVLFFLFFS